MVELNTLLLVGLVVFCCTVAWGVVLVLLININQNTKAVPRIEDEDQQGQWVMPLSSLMGHSGGSGSSLAKLAEMYAAAKHKEDSKSADAGSGTYL